MAIGSFPCYPSSDADKSNFLGQRVSTVQVCRFNVQKLVIIAFGRKSNLGSKSVVFVGEHEQLSLSKLSEAM